MSEPFVVVSGASGMIGTALIHELESRDFTVKKLVRRRAEEPNEVAWDPVKSLLNPAELAGAHAVINLSGASVSKLPWTQDYRRELLQSRITSTNTITQAIARAEQPPRVLINASAGGIYGDRPGELLPDNAQPDEESFLGKLALRWEKATQKASPYCRVVSTRNAMVLAKGKGGLAPFELITKFYVGTIIGGSQHWPWISLHDEVRAIIHLMDSELHGSVNMTSPSQDTMTEIMKELGRALHRPVFLRMPKFMAGILGQGGRELTTFDQQMVPKKLLDDGFEFAHPTIQEALQNIYAKN